MNITKDTSLQEILGCYEQSVKISEDDEFNNLFGIKSGSFNFIMSTNLILKRVLEQQKLPWTKARYDLDRKLSNGSVGSTTTSYLSMHYKVSGYINLLTKHKNLFSGPTDLERHYKTYNVALPLARIDSVSESENWVSLLTGNKLFLNAIKPVIQDLTYGYGIDVSLDMQNDDTLFFLVEYADSWYHIYPNDIKTYSNEEYKEICRLVLDNFNTQIKQKFS